MEMRSYPIVLGHEGAGIVEKFGTNVKPGDYIIMSYWSDDKCGKCLSGKEPASELCQGLHVRCPAEAQGAQRQLPLMLFLHDWN